MNEARQDEYRPERLAPGEATSLDSARFLEAVGRLQTRLDHQATMIVSVERQLLELGRLVTTLARRQEENSAFLVDQLTELSRSVTATLNGLSALIEGSNSKNQSA